MQKIASKRPATISIQNQILLRNLRLGLTIVFLSLQVFGVLKAEMRDPDNIPRSQIEQLSRRRIFHDTPSLKSPPSMLQRHLSRVEPAGSSDRRILSTNRDNSRCSSLKRILLGGSQIRPELTVRARPRDSSPYRNKEITTNIRRSLEINQLNKDAAKKKLKEKHAIDLKDHASPKFRIFGDYYDMYDDDYADGYDDYDDYDDDYDDYYDDYGMDYPLYY